MRFLQEYAKNNLTFWALTTQNEPSDGYIYKLSISSLGFTPESQADFVVQNLGPTLAKNGFGKVKILMLDDQRAFLPEWPKRVGLHDTSNH